MFSADILIPVLIGIKLALSALQGLTGAELHTYLVCFECNGNIKISGGG